MASIFVISGVIAIVFCVFKFVEMRFIEKETKPVKELVKDSIIVYICVLIGYYILEQLSPLLKDAEKLSSAEVFTGDPGF